LSQDLFLDYGRKYRHHRRTNSGGVILMTLARQEIDVARKVKAIEYLKAELVDNNAQIMYNMLTGDEDELLDAISDLVLTAYILARRCGLDFAKLDLQVLEKARSKSENRDNLEKWYGDYTGLIHYLLERSGQVGERKLL
jgi:hypothetical protein